MATSVPAQHEPGDGLIPAAGYVRVSTRRQSDKYSPKIQREAIHAFAARQGYDLMLMAEDIQRGSVVSREGYQQVLDAVRGGVVSCVCVYMFDRWGRKGDEWISRAKELERLGVDFISVQEGKEEAGMMRFVRAGMAEEYSRQLAKRVRPAKEASVRAGQHSGITPVGYRRVYAARENTSKYVPGLLVPDEPAATTVREAFRRYASGGWTLRSLAQWMNSDPACPRAPKGGDWTICNVQYLLRNPVYAGRIRYNTHRVGYYDTSPKGSEFIAQGRHEALIDEGLFDQVQRRLDSARRHEVRSRLGRPPALGLGLFVCATCGGPMVPSRRRDESSRRPQYLCRHDRDGIKVCDGRGYGMDLAHAALLAQVERLRGCPWDPERVKAVVEMSPAHDERADLQRALDSAKAEYRRHSRRFTDLVEDPTPEEVAEHRAIGREINDRVKALSDALARLPEAKVNLPDLATLHQRLTHTEIGAVVRALADAGDESALRDLALLLVKQARVVERVPENKTKWVRVEAAWTDDVGVLLKAGLLTVAPDVGRPDYPATLKELRRQKYLRYNARKKAGVIGIVPPARNGLSAPISSVGAAAGSDLENQEAK
jgi:DNA invertase Pin-like site-specific DNA recombinase